MTRRLLVPLLLSAVLLGGCAGSEDVPHLFADLVLPLSAAAAPATSTPEPDPVVIYVHPSRPPGIDLWPPAPYVVNCQPAGVREATASGGIVTGVLRSAGGRWEILYAGAWVSYDPPRHQFYARVYYRVGPCWVGGHGHGSDGEVGTSEDTYFPVVHGRPPTLIETVDMKWYPVRSQPYGLYWLRSEWQRITGNADPPPPPPPASLCGNSRCDPSEQFTCRRDCPGCGNGTCDQGEASSCPGDCPPPDKPDPTECPERKECPVCPVCDGPACAGFVEPVRVLLAACGAESALLKADVARLKGELADCKSRSLVIPEWAFQTLTTLTTASVIGPELRPEINRLAGWLEPALGPLPAREQETVRIARTAILWGLARKHRAGELLTYVLSRGVREVEP